MASLGFRMLVQNNILNWITWPKCHRKKLRWRRLPFGFHKRAISTPQVGELSSNLVHWCRMAPCSKTVANITIFLQKQDENEDNRWQKIANKTTNINVKTTVCTLVNGRITHQKQKISEKKVTLLSSTLTLWQCHATSYDYFYDICSLWCVMRALTSV